MKLNLLFVLLFCSLMSFSQQLTLKGRFILEGAKPVDLVEVLLSKKDSLVHTTMLGEEGTFIFSHLSEGAYTLEVKQWGEVVYTENLELNADTDLGNIKIAQSKEIQGVVITGKKKLIERKIDRLVFNVENSTAALGGDALDALKITPGIQVQEDQISIIGKSTMKVMINERMIQLSGNDLVNYLKSIPSDNIKSIEIITAPPAKYEVEGNSGLINIVLKTSKKNNWNSYVDGSYKQSKYALFSENMGFNLNYKKITLNSNISHWDGVNYSQKTRGNVFFPDETIQSGTILKSKVKNNFYGNLDLDYQFTSDFSSGFQVIYNKFNQSLTENNQQYFYRKVSDPLLTETFSTGNSEKENYTINTHAQYKLDSLGNKITLNLDYFKYNTNRDRYFYSKNYLNFDKYIPNEDYTAQNTSNQKISNFSGKIDGEQSLKNIKINYGIKIAHTENSSDLGYYEWIKNNPVLQVDKSDSFKYKENIQALYLSGNGKLGEKWETQLGIRVEATQSSGTSIKVNEKHDYDYVKIFPGAYVLYHIDENNKINFTYTKRVNRPSYSALNPFVRYINQNNTVSGNPYLKPSFSDNLEINYVRKNNWSTGIYFYQAKNAVNAVNYLDDNQVYLATKYENCSTDYSFGLNQSYTLNQIRGLESYFNVNVYYKENKSHIKGFQSNNNLSAYLETNNNLFLNKSQTVSFSMNYRYSFPEYIATEKVKATSNLGLGMKGVFMNKKLILTLYANDIFKTSQIKKTTYYRGNESGFSNYEFTRFIRFSIKYNLGNGTIKSKSTKPGNEEERNRAN